MGGARPVPRPHPQNRKGPSEVRLSYPAAPPTREGMSGNYYLGPARPSGYITITWSGRRAYHKHRTSGFPGPVQDRVPSSPVEMELPAPCLLRLESESSSQLRSYRGTEIRVR